MTPTEFKAERKRLGLSQAKLAKLLGIAPNSVARYERGVLKIAHPAWLQAIMREIAEELKPATTR